MLGRSATRNYALQATHYQREYHVTTFSLCFTEQRAQRERACMQTARSGYYKINVKSQTIEYDWLKSAMSYDCLLLNNFVWNVFQPFVSKRCLEESPTKIGVRHANRSFGCGCFPNLAEKHIPQLKTVFFHTQETSD